MARRDYILKRSKNYTLYALDNDCQPDDGIEPSLNSSHLDFWCEDDEYNLAEMRCLKCCYLIGKKTLDLLKANGITYNQNREKAIISESLLTKLKKCSSNYATSLSRQDFKLESEYKKSL